MYMYYIICYMISIVIELAVQAASLESTALFCSEFSVSAGEGMTIRLFQVRLVLFNCICIRRRVPHSQLSAMQM